MDREEYQAQIIAEANEIVRGYFRFTNEWDMEQCNKSYRLIDNKTCYSPNKDGEWVYQYSRMEFLHKLIFAFRNTADDMYLSAYKEIITHFYNSNNQTDNALLLGGNSVLSKLKRRIKFLLKRNVFKQEHVPFPTYRTLDTAIRNYSILVDLYVCDALKKDEKFIEYVEERIDQDMSFPKENLRKEFDLTSNWGIIIISLYITGQFIRGKTEITCEEQILCEMLARQVRRDGSHIENSTMYHMQVLLCLLRLLYWASVVNYDCQEIVIETARRMARFADIIAAPNKHQVMYGDSDDTDLSSVLLIAENVLDIPLKNVGSRIEDYMLELEFQNLQLKTYDPCNYHVSDLLDGVWYYNDAVWDVRMFNDISKSSHKHADNAELVLYYKKHPVLVDCGRYSYYHCDQRIYYRGPYAHNITVIDDGIEWRNKNKNCFQEIPNLLVTQKLNMNGFGQGCLMGYEFPSINERTWRYLLIVDAAFIVDINFVQCPGNHVLSKIYNFGDSCKPIIVNKSIQVKTDDDVLCITEMGKITLQKGWISSHYNEEHESVQATVTQDFKDCAILFSMIAPFEKNYHSVVKKKEKGYFMEISEENRKYEIEAMATGSKAQPITLRIKELNGNRESQIIL